MKITLIHPSRGRANLAINTAIKWVENITTHDFEYLLSVDSSDPALPEYKRLFDGVCPIIVSDNKNVVDASNAAAVHSTGEIIVLVSDDFECYKGWDKDIADAFAAHPPGAVLKTFDGVQSWIVTLPIMDRTYYKEQGYFYHPDYRHMFCDTDMTHKADVEGKLIFRNDLLFKHAHYSTGLNKKDEVNIKADSTWDQGQALYLKRVNEGFGLAINKMIRPISPEGRQHANWLKSKLLSR